MRLKNIISIKNLLITFTISYILLNFATTNQNQVKCSSYLDDYFLPTAKLALNKLQQSLSPSSKEQKQNDIPKAATSSLSQKKTTLDNISINSNNNNNLSNAAAYESSSSTTTSTELPTPSIGDQQQQQQLQFLSTNTNNNNNNNIINNNQKSNIDSLDIRGTSVEVNNEKEQTVENVVQVSSNKEEPNKNEFVKLIEINPQDFSPNNAPSSIPTSNNNGAESPQTSTSTSPSITSADDVSSQPTTTLAISSTQATDFEPTINVSREQLDNNDSAVQVVSSPERGASGASLDLAAQISTDSSPLASSSSSSSTTTTPSSLSTTTTTTTMQTTPDIAIQESAAKAGVAYSEPSIEQQPEVVVEVKHQTTAAPDSTIESKSAEEAVRETELEAVAAVEASIGFGTMDMFNSMTDPCYDEYGNARYCEPEFENAAFEKTVEVSSECGQPPSRFCTAFLNEHNDQIRNCHICDAQIPKKRHPASYLTDLNNFNNPTCWVSAPITATVSNTNTNTNNNNSSSNDPLLQQQQLQQQQYLESDNVTLTLNLGKKYEITYISMQFCSMKPDSLAIYKSMDYGLHWVPYQFYSSQCRRMYGRQSRSIVASASPNAGGGLSAMGQPPVSLSRSLNDLPGVTAVSSLIEPNCLNSSQLVGQLDSTNSNSHTTQTIRASSNSGRIAFSPLDGRVSGGVSGHTAVEKSLALQDWITATNIRIVLDRHQASVGSNWMVHPPSSGAALHSTYHHPHHHAHNHETAAATAATSDRNKNSSLQEEQQQAENSLTNPSDTFNYAMSDLTLGARCKCNGHASRCIHNKDGGLQCDCRHNTAGKDCEKCAPFHHDRPWARATQLDANPCQPCNCNGHSRKCKFDAELYRLSGKRSGGVCTGCRDNTAGRHCHYCREGFTRDHSKPMSDKEACKHCDCHPIGSLHRVCNHITGQCPCKEGVAGLQCNRCAAGYQQSSSLSEPCIKLPENDINYEPSLALNGDEQQQQQTAEVAQANNNNNNNNNNIVVDQQNPSVSTINNNNNNDNNEPSIATIEETQPPKGAVVRGAPSGGKMRPPFMVESNSIGGGGAMDAVVASEGAGGMELDINKNKQEDEQDGASGGDLESSSANRRQHSSRHWNKQQQDRRMNKYNNNNNYNYYSYHNNNNRRQYKQPAVGLDLDDVEQNGGGIQQQQVLRSNNANNLQGGDMHDDDNNNSGNEFANSSPRLSRPTAAGYPSYSSGSGVNNDYRFNTQSGYQHQHQHQHSAGGRRPPASAMGSARATNQILMKPPSLASVDHGEDMMTYDDQETPIYAIPPNSMYNDDAFNQIPHHLHHNAAAQQPAPSQTTTNMLGNSARQHHQQQGGATYKPLAQQQNNNIYQSAANGNNKRRRLNGVGAYHTALVNDDDQQQPQQQPPPMGPNSILCGDCQTGTRRLGFKQFCHLDYAIKATLLAKFVAQDWTRLDVEVQDIFKSPAGSGTTSPTLQQVVAASGRGGGENSRQSRGISMFGYNNNMIQDEDNQVASNQVVATGRLSTNNSTLVGDVAPPDGLESHYKIKIGTIHSIWVPTEDLTCKCPRLRLRTTYLLMGSIDAKENSVNWFQLDRHGIALEWKASLQEKLIKYQRRHSKGRC